MGVAIKSRRSDRSYQQRRRIEVEQLVFTSLGHWQMGLSTANALCKSAARLLDKMLTARIFRRPPNILFQHRWRCVLMLPHSRKFATPSVRLSGVTAPSTRAPPQNDRNGTSHHEHTLYERRPDWYIRLIPLLIVLDLAMLYVPSLETSR
jgi:hypothetical protein